MNKQFNNEAMITSMEWVKEAVETAMEDKFKPVCKKCTCGTNLQTQLIDSIESLRQELGRAMAPMMEPVMKTTTELRKFETERGDSISEEQDYIYQSDLNQYEKAVLLYMHHYSTWPQTMVEIADACGISVTSVKRVIKRFMESGECMRAPYEPGYILTKFS